MKKVWKVIGIIILAIVIIYSIFITIEVVRFNNIVGCKPLIILKDTSVDTTKEIVTGLSEEKYTSLGFTVEYQTNIIREENSDNIQIAIMGGEFKLFDKIILSAYVF